MQGQVANGNEVDVLDRARDELLGMLDTVEEMFALSVRLVCNTGRSAEERDLVFETDAQVDRGQRQLRRDIVAHLAANWSGDAVMCLVLMVAAKDTERIGDYCKNLAELVDLAEKPLGGAAHGAALPEVFAAVARLFGPTKRVCRSADAALAEQVRAKSANIEERCSRMIHLIARDPKLGENQAVCLALALRACKRISAHLANVAYTVTELADCANGVELE